MIVTRFAPSPTGYLHLGHLHSALIGWLAAREGQGRFLLRIEDIDPARCRPEFEQAIVEDLHWAGIDWADGIRRQSEHLADYRAGLDRLAALGLVYPCFCSRKDIAAAIAAPHGAEGPLYPGTCRNLPRAVAAERQARGAPYALRFHSRRAAEISGPLTFHDHVQGVIGVDPDLLGDVVLARRDAPASYHLCVTLDDHLQGVTLVTRGVDLLPATHVHRLLQAVLGLAVPHYCHHLLVTNDAGQRLAKRDKALSLRAMREGGMSAAAVRTLAGIDRIYKMLPKLTKPAS
ncbi:MAG TPA: tRNA glutamyl-Q(34) synthetase GluQRS [Terriglobia bacterium]|nr:tRNA glutamyl-Q(34) synthetase GluQRS [Terriglobia bacterium]